MKPTYEDLEITIAELLQARLPVVVIEICGGMINLARSSVAMRVVILDQDIEGGNAENVVTVDGEQVYLTNLLLTTGSDPGFGGVAPIVVQEILAQVDADASSPRTPRQV